MHACMCSNYLQKLIITQTNIDSEYLGADTELNSEILDFFALESGIKTRQKACVPDNESVKLDEYELAMAG